MYSLIDLIFTVFTVVSVLLQGYCLQYFLGSFLESRTKAVFMGFMLWLFTGCHGYVSIGFPQQDMKV